MFISALVMFRTFVVMQFLTHISFDQGTSLSWSRLQFVPRYKKVSATSCRCFLFCLFTSYALMFISALMLFRTFVVMQFLVHISFDQDVSCA